MSVARSVNRSISSPPSAAVLPLEPGDHLTRAEFERRYDAMPSLKKAELIEGVVYGLASAAHAKFVASLKKRLADDIE